MINFGQKVVLGPLSMASSSDLYHWRNDYNIWRYCRQSDLLTEGSHEKWYQGQLLGDHKNKMYSIIFQDIDNQVNHAIGVCGLTSIDICNRNAEFSLYIASKFQKSGFGKAALITLISHGFYNLNLENIWGESFEFNPARNMFKNIGMQEDGRRRNFYYKEGKYIDAYLYSILRKEWDKSAAFEAAREQKCFI